MFGFGEKKEKEREQRKVKWVAPTTGNVYYEGDELPRVGDFSGTFCMKDESFQSFDDWLDMEAPERAKRDKRVAENVDEMKTNLNEMKKMMVSMARRQEELENMVASLIRRQYDREQRETKAEMEEETEYQR